LAKLLPATQREEREKKEVKNISMVVMLAYGGES
jgi:hypothetical protein